MRQSFGQLGVAVFAGSIEWRGTRITEAGHVMFADAQGLLMKIVKAELGAECGDLRSRLVVAGENVDPLAAGLHDLSARIEATRPIHQVPGGEIVVGLCLH
jgi:hypothetical protein